MKRNSRLYLITPPRIDDLDRFVADYQAALDGGDVACVQLRLKDADGAPVADDVIMRAASVLLPPAVDREIEFLINDRPDLALKAGADGVHIGQGDAPYEQARKILGDDATIGVTCHDSRHLGLVAGEAGADYVAFGAFFPTQTKTAPTEADPEILRWWTYATTVPSVAIGGVTPENCGILVRAGADFLAVSGAVWNAPDGPAAAVKAFEQAIDAAQRLQSLMERPLHCPPPQSDGGVDAVRICGVCDQRRLCRGDFLFRRHQRREQRAAAAVA